MKYSYFFKIKTLRFVSGFYTVIRCHTTAPVLWCSTLRIALLAFLTKLLRTNCTDFISFFRKLKPSNEAPKSVHDKSLVAEKNQIDEELCFSVIITLLFCIGLAVNIACLFRSRPYAFLLSFWRTDYLISQWKKFSREHSNIT